MSRHRRCQSLSLPILAGAAPGHDYTFVDLLWEDDPRYDKQKAAYLLRSFVELHPHAIAEKRGATLVPPYDDPMIIAGQGTAGREIMEDLDALGLKPDVVVIGASGGGPDGAVFPDRLLPGFLYFPKRTGSRLVVRFFAVLIFGVVLALMGGFPIFGFLQGASQNWLLVANTLLLGIIVIVPAIFIPHGKKFEPILQAALANGQITSELRTAMNDKVVRLAHLYEGFSLLVIMALMVTKPF